jgi:thiol-disulfide isomerase/thioredoxin
MQVSVALWLVWAGLFQLRVARANPDALRVDDLLNRQRVEMKLLHVPIDRVVLNALPVWDEKTGKARLRVPGEVFDDIRPILLLHLWATWCGPCKEEFGAWKELGNQIQQRFSSEVNVVHIAMQQDATPLAGFVNKQGKNMPGGAKYLDEEERLSKLLQQALQRKDLPVLPITLWLGPGRTVRQVLVGAISGRVDDVLHSTERLVNDVKTMQKNSHHLPKYSGEDVFTVESPCRCPCICN